MEDNKYKSCKTKKSKKGLKKSQSKKSFWRRRMEFGKFGVLVKIEDHVLACLVGLAILLVFKLKESFPSRSFPNLQVGSILGTLVGSAISATGLVGSRVGEDTDGKCDPLKTWQLHDDNDGNVNDVKNASVLHRQQPGACGPWWHCCRLFSLFCF